MARETLGKLSVDLLSKKHEPHNPIDYTREMLEGYDKNISECVDRYKDKFWGDFYVVVLTKKERLLKNVLRSYFFGRVSCPTPDYDQAVYRYHESVGSLEFLWVVPSKDTCELLKANAAIVDKSEWELLHYVLQFYDDTLFKQCKKLNGEVDDSPLLKSSKGT